jgi:hypothetical protein
MTIRWRPSTPLGARRVVVGTLAGAVFLFSWFFRFNDPGGSFAGMTDDHFFYVVRGWQILFGDLPVRDFVDHGAPLYYYVAAAVQLLFGRGTLSEVAFSVTVLSAGAALTFWLATRASGVIALGLVGAAFHILLAPRLYNYPKIIVYAVAIPLLWRFAERRDSWTRGWLALVTAIGFLLRHDHGAMVALAVATLLLLVNGVAWRERIRHAALYGVLVVALLSPYLVFIQINGGVGSYVRQASAWAARDRDRAPVVFPGLHENPDGVSEAAKSANVVERTVGEIRDNSVAWLFYSELALPVLALLVLALSRDAFRPGWVQGIAKVGTVAVLAVALNANFLRSPLGARLADPSVPHAILLAWLLAAAPAVFRRRESLRFPLRPLAMPLCALVSAAVVALVFVVGAVQTRELYDRLDAAAVAEDLGHAIERTGHVRRTLSEEWQLETWERRAARPDLINLALYVHHCTSPTDRVFVQMYMPQVLGLARRAFAGGHADLRPGFFRTDDAQALTLQRLQRQRVPVVLLETPDEDESFRNSFPRLIAYFDEHYEVTGQHEFDGGRFKVMLLTHRNAPASSRYAPLDWPCPSPQ